jgi:dihydropteroate synthase
MPFERPASVRGSLLPPARLRPLGLNVAGEGAILAGGPLAFTACNALTRMPDGRCAERLALSQFAGDGRGLPANLAGALDAQYRALVAPRAPLAGISLDRPRLMGVLNVTPDSFSNDGMALDAESAIARGRAMAVAGAAIVDVGGESTRPGSEPVPAAIQIDRVRPVIRALADDGLVVSIDARLSEVMAAALDAGAQIVNDTSALSFEPESLALVAARGVPVVLMHMQGTPQNMQHDPSYDDVVLDLLDYFTERLSACADAGIDPARLVLDPGIGFGKSVEHNVDLMGHIAAFHALGCPLLVGISRKSTIARLSDDAPVERRLGGSIAAALFCAAHGVQLIRVHDVAETRQALDVWAAFAQVVK